MKFVSHVCSAPGSFFPSGLALLICLLSLEIACEPPPAAKGPISYTEDAKAAYDQAMVLFQNHEWLECQALFQEVKRKYPYSKYARMAELRLADSNMEQDKIIEAVRGYRAYIHDHKSDLEEIAYARSKLAEAEYKQIGDSFLAPSSDERDQSVVLDAFRELKSYLADYPDAKESSRIKMLLQDVLARLTRHELNVADFYLERNNYEAAEDRIRYALKNYSEFKIERSPLSIPNGDDKLEFDKDRDKEDKDKSKTQALLFYSGLEPECLIRLSEVLMRMKRYDEANKILALMLAKFPKSELGQQARHHLDHLKTIIR